MSNIPFYVKRFISHLLFSILLALVFSCAEDRPLEDEVVDETRFVKVHLAGDLDEPMEVAIIPNGDVIIVERKGAIKLYNKKEHRVSLVHTLNVFSGLEDGLLGVTLDPDYINNGYVYFFYSPAGDEEIQRVSRFVFREGRLDTLSEKVLIEIPTQRKECCHSAGSLAFGPDGNLYIAVGDNTNPHNPGYYNSIDERKGREYWDAQRTAGNTNDLRGKVLRIRPQPDGTYTIPAGNLFNEGDSLARPEIYAMGCRNPYRISIDQKRGWLFWGDVGQNTIDDPARGPISYDEWNVAKKPGFFGWPYFAGPNAAYADFDFETNEIGPFFDSLKPVNNSVNNSGRRLLPPAQRALIWYSYDESKEFEHLGTGGKSPIAGPVYYSDMYRPKGDGESSVAFPSYYDGKLFIAEWLRDWINVVTLTDDGRVEKIEPFMRSSPFSHPIELEFGPEGALYVLEYGVNWFSKNKDAALYRIEYVRGNRPPVVGMNADPTAGAEPLEVTFSANGSYDPDSTDRITYEWIFEGDKVQSDKPQTKHVFTRKGVYPVKLVITDNHGHRSEMIREVKVGNGVPDIDLKIKGNRSFYWDKTPLQYEIDIRDREDGSLSDGGIDPTATTVSLTYSTMGTDLALVESEEAFDTSSPGWVLIGESDCRACHAISDKSIGPSYMDVAAKYKKTQPNIDKLAQKIISGGSGVWGETAMSAHPQLSKEQAEQMVEFILSFSDNARVTRRMPLKGTINPDDHLKDESSGDYIFTVTYTDKADAQVGSNTVRERIVLRHPVVNAGNATAMNGVSKTTRGVSFERDGAWVKYGNLDLTDITSITFIAASHMIGGRLSVRVDSPSGEELGYVDIPKDDRVPKATDDGGIASMLLPFHAKLNGVEGVQRLYIVYNEPEGQRADASHALILRALSFNR